MVIFSNHYNVICHLTRVKWYAIHRHWMTSHHTWGAYTQPNAPTIMPPNTNPPTKMPAVLFPLLYVHRKDIQKSKRIILKTIQSYTDSWCAHISHSYCYTISYATDRNVYSYPARTTSVLLFDVSLLGVTFTIQWFTGFEEEPSIKHWETSNTKKIRKLEIQCNDLANCSFVQHRRSGRLIPYLPCNHTLSEAKLKENQTHTTQLTCGEISWSGQQR